jgi:hypothetical protein
MIIYGFLVASSNGIPIFSRIAEKTPFKGSLRGSKELLTITGFLSAMNQFLEKLTPDEERAKNLFLNAQVQDFAFTTKTREIKSEYRPTSGKVIFILLHSAEDFDATKALLAVLENKFLLTYSNSHILDLIENGELIHTEEINDTEFCRIYDEIIQSFGVNFSEHRLEIEFTLSQSGNGDNSNCD